MAEAEAFGKGLVRFLRAEFWRGARWLAAFGLGLWAGGCWL